MYKRSQVIFIICFSLVNTLFSQNVARREDRKIEWLVTEADYPLANNYTLGTYRFKEGYFPSISENFISTGRSSIEFIDLEYVPYTRMSALMKQRLAGLKGSPRPVVWHSLSGNTGYTGYNLCPFKEEGGRYYILKSFSISVEEGPAFGPQPVVRTRSGRAASNSLLATGKWVKLAVNKDGIYRIDATWLRQAGIDPATIDPRNLKIYGHQGGMLPEKVSAFRHEDLPENAIMVSGEQDGRFDDGDFILFYAQSPHKWVYDAGKGRYVHVTNIYSDKTWFFLTAEGGAGKRMQSSADGSGLTADAGFSWYDHHELHEEDIENICREGRIFHGEKFDQVLRYDFSHSFADASLNRTMKVVWSAGSVSPASGSMTLRVNNANNQVMSFPALLDEYSCFSTGGEKELAFQAETSLQLSFTYSKPTSGSKAWLDYYEIHCSRNLTYSSSFLAFRNLDAAAVANAEFRLQNLPASALLFDVSDPLNVRSQAYFSQGNESIFRYTTGGKLREFAMSDGNYPSPEFHGSVPNQNLRGSAFSRFIIITHPDFLQESERLAGFHRTRDNMDVMVVTPQQIYNEFSSGSQDITAIRDFLRYMYYRNTNPANNLRYAMLMGDASFDYKDKVKGNSNFVPVYENDPKLGISGSYDYYCSDDYYGFLDSADGEWLNEQKLEIAVTRMPVRTVQEASSMVDKIINYKAPQSLGEWRNFITMCADDADAAWEKDFVFDFEEWTANIDTSFRNVNIRKVYLDAFPQQNLGGSQRYPDAQEAIRKEFEKGTLIFNYVGHGGEEYLATEKVIDIPLINTMKNRNNLPVFFTATCEFSRYDDALRKSAGEYLITQSDGGAVAMFTTTRVVFAGPNAMLTRFFWTNCAFVKQGGEWPTLGDIYMKLKNWYGQNDNDRKFTLFADPALTMNYPEHILILDSILHSGAQTDDTLKALGKVTFKGHVEDIGGQRLNTFNGTVYPIVYDKQSVFKTLSNDLPGQPLDFRLYSNILYKGQNSVVNGDFSFTFVVPKDINYNYGYGKISLYADNGQTDASGHRMDIIVGGTSASATQDVKGPEIELFIDDHSFVSGGLTDHTPLLLARVSDENGINTSGIGIGRDIIAIIDKGTPNEKKYILNSFYTARLNSYTEGDIRYQLEGLSEGRHTYTLKVWDVYNNSSESTIEFLVRNSGDFEISQVLNYPNPFSSQTTFHFNHNRAGEDLHVVISVMTVTGRVIKTIEQHIQNADSHVGDIVWNGRDDYDDKPSRGVYIYRITVSTADGKKAGKVEKLVILN